MAQIKVLTGRPLFDPGQAFGASIYGDNVSPPTSTQFTANSYSNDFKVVFTGNFTVSGGDITGGTVTGFTAFAGATRVEIGKGFSVDAAAFYDAFQANDYDTIYDMLFATSLKLVGSKYDDDLSGGASADTLLGKAGGDWLSGEGGNDVLKGGAGNDGLSGGDGFDKLKGGAGDDVFYFFFDSALPPTSHDTIKDFKSGKDTIALVDFADVLPPGYLAN